MKNFNELFEEAKELSDRRLKAFDILKEKFTIEILPEFAKVLNACDYETAFFNANNKVFSEDMFEFEDHETDTIDFCFGITKDGEIFSARHEYDGYRYKWELLDNGLESIRNVGVIELVNLVRSRTEKYNLKLFNDAVKAEKLAN